MRLQRLAQAAIALAFGAILMGIVGLLAAWLGHGSSTHVALILIVPGGLMVLVAAYMLALALRVDPDDWRPAYKKIVRMLEIAATVAFLATVVTAVIVRADGPAPQILLIALVGIQGPFAMYLLTRQLVRALK